MHWVNTMLALFRLSDKAVCEISNDNIDYHDYPDAATPEDPRPDPMHFYEYTCSRCGKKFFI
jgi:hypothetical protein